MSMPPLAASISQGVSEPPAQEQPPPQPQAPPEGATPPPPTPEEGEEGDEPQPGAPPEERPKRKFVDEIREERRLRREAQAQATLLQQQQQQLQPLLEAVVTNPSVMTLLTQQGPGGQPQDPELNDLATSLGLYNAQGQPDLQAASRVLGFVDRRAQAHAQQLVGPVQQQSVMQHANTVRAQTLQVGVDAGIKHETLDKVLGLLPPELLVQPNVAALAVAVAAGIERMNGAAYAAPMVTESVGGRPRMMPLPTQLQNVLKARGLSEKDIQTHTTSYQPGGFNPLE